MQRFMGGNMITIHPTAVVETTDIGEGTYIGPFTYISKRVKIGKNCRIYNASIGLPGEHPNGAEDKGGIIEIGDNVEIREYVTINTPLFTQRTLLENGCYLMAKSHVGHDAILHERVVLHTGAIIGGHSEIGRYCYMGLNCSTHPFAKLGDYCIVGANGVYKGESPVAVVWAGVPCRPLKVNMVGLDRHCNIEEKGGLKLIAEQFLGSIKK
jgi:UDP-N-acetylglucosamine acyltransferase